MLAIISCLELIVYIKIIIFEKIFQKQSVSATITILTPKVQHYLCGVILRYLDAGRWSLLITYLPSFQYKILPHNEHNSRECPGAEDMRGLAGCQKIQKSKNPSFQTESLDSGHKDGFLDFLGFFLDFFGFFERVFGFLGFQVKNPKKLKEKDGFLQKSNFFLGFFWIFWKNPSFSLSFFGFLISGLEKSIFFLGFFLDFCKNQSFS